jgi:uncharacterized membrane protein YhaH (DUF805 family)
MSRAVTASPGGPVDFQGAIRQQFQNILTFTGRASRSAFWWFWLAGFIVNLVLQIIARTAGSTALSLLVSLVVLAVSPVARCRPGAVALPARDRG